ncbi:MAG: glyoxalase [Leifsonia xyli]|nr:MAG: glyoxalase [Leifsonia xyli]
MIEISYVNIISSDIDRLGKFYSTLLELEEIVESRTDLFRGYKAGTASLGISAEGAYDLLNLTKQQGSGERNLLTFNVPSPKELRALTEKAQKLGGSLVKAPFETYYGWFQSVLRDPDGNAFRLSFSGREQG